MQKHGLEKFCNHNPPFVGTIPFANNNPSLSIVIVTGQFLTYKAAGKFIAEVSNLNSFFLEMLLL